MIIFGWLWRRLHCHEYGGNKIMCAWHHCVRFLQQTHAICFVFDGTVQIVGNILQTLNCFFFFLLFLNGTYGMGHMMELYTKYDFTFDLIACVIYKQWYLLNLDGNRIHRHFYWMASNARRSNFKSFSFISVQRGHIIMWRLENDFFSC